MRTTFCQYIPYYPSIVLSIRCPFRCFVRLDPFRLLQIDFSFIFSLHVVGLFIYFSFIFFFIFIFSCFQFSFFSYFCTSRFKFRYCFFLSARSNSFLPVDSFTSCVSLWHIFVGLFLLFLRKQRTFAYHIRSYGSQCGSYG